MSRAVRLRVSVALLVLAAVAIAAATCSIYVERNVFDSAAFADHAEEALEYPAVRAVAAERLTEVVVEEIAPDAVAVRPLIEATADSMLSSSAFGRIFRSSALQLHRAAVDGDVDGAVLTLANVGILVSSGLRRLDPDLAKEIPEELDARLMRVARGEGLGRFTHAARALDQLRELLVGLALLLVAGAFAVSPRRRRTVQHFGFTLIAAGTLIAVVWFAARSWLIASADLTAADVVAAAEDLWDVFMYGLLRLAVLVIGLGAVLVAATDGALGGVRLSQRLVRAWAQFSPPPQNPWLRLLWSLAVLALGGLIVLNPEEALQLAVTVAGLLLVAAGLQQLAIMASPDAQEDVDAEEPRARVGRSLVYGLVAAVVVVLLASAYFRLADESPLQALGFSTNSATCNGAERLCDRPLDGVALPMTHNAMSATGYPGFLFPAQEGTIASQLSDGIRGLAVDVYFGFPGSRVFTDTDRSSPQARSVMKREFGEEFVGAADRIRRQLSRPVGAQSELFLCHGFCELGAVRLRDALADVEEFLQANPREVLVLIFEDYVPAADLAAAIEASGVASHAYRGPWTRPLPTLGEMIERDERVLLLTEHATPEVEWMHSAYELAQETPFRFDSIAELQSRKSCRDNRGSATNPLFLVNHWVDTPPNPRPSIARRVNQREFILKRTRTCQDIRGLTANMISVDFYKQGDLLGAVDTLNGLE